MRQIKRVSKSKKILKLLKELQRRRVQVLSPTVGQVESDAASDVCTKAHVADGSQADVEEGDGAHSQVEHQQEALWCLHLVLQWKNLAEQTGKEATTLFRPSHLLSFIPFL